MKCSVPGCHGRGLRYDLPLIGRSVILCRLHGPARMIATMRTLVARG